MRKLHLVLATFLVFCNFAFAEVKIAVKNRIPNDRDVGYCAWCCLETLGRHHKIKSLYDLVEKRSKLSDYKEWNKEEKRWDHYVWVNYGNTKEKELRNVGGYRAVTNKLKALGVKFRSQRSESKKLLKYAVKNDLGCMIVVFGKGVFLDGGTHAIILTEYKEDVIKFFDPNDVGHIYTANEAWLDKYWTGYTVVIEK